MPLQASPQWQRSTENTRETIDYGNSRNPPDMTCTCPNDLKSSFSVVQVLGWDYTKPIPQTIRAGEILYDFLIRPLLSEKRLPQPADVDFLIGDLQQP